MGVGWGGVYYRSWNVDHVVDARLKMITLNHAPRQGGVGWGVGGVGWGGVGWGGVGVGWGGVGWGVLSFVEC